MTDRRLMELSGYDPAAVIALNNRDAKKTSWLDAALFARLLATASFARGAGQGPDGFVIAMDNTCHYVNPNFAWFAERYDRFVYVDRVVVAEHSRGRGIARALYGDVLQFAQSRGAAIVGCEVNSDPPNPGSDAFHAALGFAEAGQALLQNGKTVRYLVRRV
ncbi:MAG: GNAT family N-acetyltransferase [Beijerinckiaceae bacterium]